MSSPRLQAGLSRRRACVGVAALAAMASSPGAYAAPSRIGFIGAGDAQESASFLDAVRGELARRGLVEPAALAIELRFAGGKLELIPKLVGELERSGVALIVTHAVATTLVVTTPRNVPAVYQFSADPVASGIATDLARPLFNATGVTLMMAELTGKRLELFRQIVPGMRRVGILANALHPGQERERAVVEGKAADLGLRTSAYTVRSEAELDAALAALAAQLPDGLLVLSDGFVVVHRQKIIDFAIARRMPVVSGWAVMAESGALCTYGPRLVEAYARVGYFVDRILKGTAASALPIEQPTILELVINAGVAKRLGVAVPQAVLARADRIIE